MRMERGSVAPRFLRKADGVNAKSRAKRTGKSLVILESSFHINKHLDCARVGDHDKRQIAGTVS
jgi:hypothetical protein